MPASVGTPTIWEKIGAVFGLDGANNAAVLAADQRDLTAGEQAVLNLFKPILAQVETQGLADLVNVAQTILTVIPSITSVSGAVNVIEAVLEAEAGPLKAQAGTLGKTALSTLVSGILTGLGKVNLPA